MQVGDRVEIRWGRTILGIGHISALPTAYSVTVKATPRVLPAGPQEVPRSRLIAREREWTLDLAVSENAA